MATGRLGPLTVVFVDLNFSRLYYRTTYTNLLSLQPVPTLQYDDVRSTSNEVYRNEK